MIKIYVAAPWKDKPLALEAKKHLESQGFLVTSRWIDFHDDKPSDQSGLAYDKDVLLKEARQDVEDVYTCDILVLLNTQKRGEETSGKAVETGMAMAWLKPVIVVGQVSNIFHHMSPVVETLDDAIAMIRGWEAKQKQIITQPGIIIPGA